VIRDHRGGSATVTARTRRSGRTRVVAVAEGAPGADTTVARAVKLR
jgi:hypothetical protein